MSLCRTLASLPKAVAACIFAMASLLAAQHAAAEPCPTFRSCGNAAAPVDGGN